MAGPNRAAPQSLHQALASLATAGVIPSAAFQLDISVETVTAALRHAVRAEVPAFAASGNPDILPQLAQHSREHIDAIRSLVAGDTTEDFAFVREHARRRAEQRFPLEAMLHAYRCGHKVLAHWLRDAALATAPQSVEAAVSAVADFAIEYTNTISTITASEYVAHMRSLAEAEGDLRTELLGILLAGYDESDGRVARLLRNAGYLEQRHSYCIVAARSVNPAEMENHARALRIVSAITDAVAATSIRVLAGVRNNLVIAVLSDRRRQSGWTAAQTDLSERVQPLLMVMGPAVLAGVSGDHPSTSFIPKALAEAAAALDFASVTKRVVAFGGLPLKDLLIHRGADAVRTAPPKWIGALIEADAKASGALVETLRALAQADMNTQKAARLLARHPNTVYTRLERIKELTGLDGQRYADLTELLLAADCWRL
jgi:DNA-binding CsgD family transcriptional regulator